MDRVGTLCFVLSALYLVLCRSSSGPPVIEQQTKHQAQSTKHQASVNRRVARRRECDFNSPVLRAACDSSVRRHRVGGSHAVGLNTRGFYTRRLKTIRQHACAFLRELLQLDFITTIVSIGFDQDLIVGITRQQRGQRFKLGG